MCANLVDDTFVEFGGGAAVGAFVGLDLPFALGDELELQVLFSSNDGDVQLYAGRAQSAQAGNLALRLPALASEPAGRAVRVKVRALQYSVFTSCAAGSRVTVIARLYRGKEAAACRS